MAELPDNPIRPRWYQSLRWLLLGGNLLLAIGFGATAFWFNQQHLEQPLAEKSAHLLEARQLRLQDQLEAIARNTVQFSLALNGLAVSHWGQEQSLRRMGAALMAKIPADSPIVAAGIWPEPRQFNPKRERSSLYWTLGAEAASRGGRFHDDYNDPANISYHGEIWYTPARYYQGQGCFWSPRYLEAFLRKPVVACAVAVEIDGRFAGVTSLVLDLTKLSTALPQLSSDAPFYLLLDQQQAILSAAGIATAANDNLPALAQTDPRFGQVAVQLHQRGEALLTQARQADPNWAGVVKTLSESTRGLAQRQAELLLARLRTPPAAQVQSLTIAGSKAAPTDIRLSEVAELGTLLVGQFQPPLVNGIRRDWLVSAATSAGAIFLALLISFAWSQRLTLAPLHKLLEQLQRPAEDTRLEDSAPHEMGLLKQQLNARHERIRDLLDQREFLGARGPKFQTVKTAEKPPAAAAPWEILDAFSDALVVTDKTGKVEYLNTAAETLSGWKLTQARNLGFDEIFHILDRRGKSRLTDLAVRAVSAGRASERPLQTVFKTRSGHELPLAITSSPVRGENQAISSVLLILHDIRSNSATAAPEFLTQVRDPLTGCLNRAAFDAELASRCEATRLGGEPPFSMLYIDADRMQYINDAFGTQGGDEFLRQLARMIQTDVGESNPVYRLHGDKFAVLLATEDSAEAQVTAELLRADVQSGGFQWNNERRDVSITSSLLQIDSNSGRPVDILRAADELCQQAQAEGRGRVVSGQVKKKSGERRDDRSWLNNIKRGLTEAGFHLSTQQLSNLQRNADKGVIFDTLLLLEDDEGFWTGAPVFMPIAERYNLGLDLDRWTVQHVFDKLSQDVELTAEIDFCMISLSVNSLQTPVFLDFLMENFKDSGVPPHKICFDLKEQDVYSRLSVARDFCQAVTRAGCRMSLTNVSTRPSSYGLLKELPIHLVRFDPTLTRNADSDAVDRLATESLHRIVHSLGKQSLVTQINTPELLRIMQGIGVDYAQGDAIARSTPVMFQAQA